MDIVRRLTKGGSSFTLVYDAIEEAKEIVDNEQALPDRLIEIRNALNRVTDNQEMSLGI